MNPTNKQSEKSIQNAILRAYATRPDMRLARANTGAGVPYSVVKDALGLLRCGDVQGAARVLSSARPVTFGTPGQADLGGIIAGAGRRLEVEVKSPTGRQSPEQKQYQGIIERFGGVYILARSVADVSEGLRRAGYDI